MYENVSKQRSGENIYESPRFHSNHSGRHTKTEARRRDGRTAIYWMITLVTVIRFEGKRAKFEEIANRKADYDCGWRRGSVWFRLAEGSAPFRFYFTRMALGPQKWSQFTAYNMNPVLVRHHLKRKHICCWQDIRKGHSGLKVGIFLYLRWVYLRNDFWLDDIL